MNKAVEAIKEIITIVPNALLSESEKLTIIRPVLSIENCCFEKQKM